MYGVIDEIIDGDKISARLYDDEDEHEFIDVATFSKDLFPEKDWFEIMSHPGASFIFLISVNCKLKRTKNMTTEIKTDIAQTNPRYLALESGKTVCLEGILMVSEINKVESLCSDSFIFHVHYKGQSTPIVMSYDGTAECVARLDQARLSRKLTGEE